MKLITEDEKDVHFTYGMISNEEGLMENHYTCTYCGHKRQMEVTIAQLIAQIKDYEYTPDRR